MTTEQPSETPAAAQAKNESWLTAAVRDRCFAAAEPCVLSKLSAIVDAVLAALPALVEQERYDQLWELHHTLVAALPEHEPGAALATLQQLGRDYLKVRHNVADYQREVDSLRAQLAALEAERARLDGQWSHLCGYLALCEDENPTLEQACKAISTLRARVAELDAREVAMRSVAQDRSWNGALTLDGLRTLAQPREGTDGARLRDAALTSLLADVDARLAERSQLEHERDNWREEARRYAGNVDYWRGLAQRPTPLAEDAELTEDEKRTLWRAFWDEAEHVNPHGNHWPGCIDRTLAKLRELRPARAQVADVTEPSSLGALRASTRYGPNVQFGPESAKELLAYIDALKSRPARAVGMPTLAQVKALRDECNKTIDPLIDPLSPEADERVHRVLCTHVALWRGAEAQAANGDSFERGDDGERDGSDLTTYGIHRNGPRMHGNVIEVHGDAELRDRILDGLLTAPSSSPPSGAPEQSGPVRLPEKAPEASAKRHELKTWPAYFAALRNFTKTFEVRLNDRGFAVDDVLVLREWDPATGTYTGAVEQRRVTYVMVGGSFGVAPGYCVLGFEEARYAAPAPHAEEPEPVDIERLRAALWSARNNGDKPEALDEYDAAYDAVLAALTELAARREAETRAARDVIAERRRQTEAEGWTIEHDDEHTDGALTFAAASYCLLSLRCSAGDGTLALEMAVKLWPFDADFKPSDTRRRELVKAGALILAEIERLDRIELRKRAGAPS